MSLTLCTHEKSVLSIIKPINKLNSKAIKACNFLFKHHQQVNLMQLIFKLHHQVNFGEEVHLRLQGSSAIDLPMICLDDKTWQVSLQIIEPKEQLLAYSYSIYREGKEISLEPKRFSHYLPLKYRAKELLIEDFYLQDLPYSYLYTAPFFKASFEKAQILENSLNFRARAMIPQGFSLKVCGNCEALGNWDLNKALELKEVNPNYFMLSVPKESLPQNFEYKYVCANNRLSLWQNGENQSFVQDNTQDLNFTCESIPNFSLAHPHLAGTAVPVFALRSKGSFGVGDFGDLKLLVDWAVETSQKIIQILPINDTTMTGTWKDSYPYNAISIYAFHPMFLNLRALPSLLDHKKAQAFEKERVKLNALAKIDYEAVNKYKLEYARLIFKQEWQNIQQSAKYKNFFLQNQEWLLPYAAFSVLRDRYQNADFTTWPEKDFNPSIIEKLEASSQDKENLDFYCFLQFKLHVQLLEVSDYARENGVSLKGDIPIGVSRTSVEAWVEPQYFNLKSQAGAPPDPFAADGQNWGFPTYNWNEMQKDGLSWWKKRFSHMAQYFSAYRIDHILGFFRIWQIPLDSVHGLLGHFEPALPFSAAEIESFGLSFQKDFMTKPFINDVLIAMRFGPDAQMVKKTFLEHLHHDIYALKEEFSTQRKIEAYFKDKTELKDLNLRDNLYRLVSDVLFIEDENQKGFYHPRISVMDDYIFSRLAPHEKEAFKRLYNHYFYERHNQFWYQKAMEKLPGLINSTSMLTCGEDLGMVPDCVPWVMKKLEILSLEIERMPKALGQTFNDVEHYPEMSVCTIGTHDMSTLRGWWREDKALSSRYFKEVLHREGLVPTDLPADLCEEVVTRYLKSPSLLAILTLQDWLAISDTLRSPDIEGERINVPAIPRYYWRYRMHLNLEDLIANHSFNRHISQLIQASGR